LVRTISFLLFPTDDWFHLRPKSRGAPNGLVVSCRTSSSNARSENSGIRIVGFATPKCTRAVGVPCLAMRTAATPAASAARTGGNRFPIAGTALDTKVPILGGNREFESLYPSKRLLAARHVDWPNRAGLPGVARESGVLIRFAPDSPPEGTGFEPSVPLLQKALLGVANRDGGTISGTT
jgi:hypothetical protein